MKPRAYYRQLHSAGCPSYAAVNAPACTCGAGVAACRRSGERRAVNLPMVEDSRRSLGRRKFDDNQRHLGAKYAGDGARIRPSDTMTAQVKASEQGRGTAGSISAQTTHGALEISQARGGVWNAIIPLPRAVAVAVIQEVLQRLAE